MRLTSLLATCLLIMGCSSGSNDVPTVGESAGTASSVSDQTAQPEIAQTASAPRAAEVGDMTPVAVEGGVASLSAENTRIQFVGTHAEGEPNPRTGVFSEFSGKAEIDSSKKLRSVSVEIQTNSLTTAMDRLTNHLHSGDFFDVREYPVAKFESTSIGSAGGEGEYTITGNLTMREATKEVSFPAAVTVTDAGLTLASEFTIDRMDFGVGLEQKGVVNEVALTIVIGQKSGLSATAGGGFGRGRGGRGGGGGGGRPDPADLFSRQDADGDGKLSGDEIPGWMAGMQGVDADSDGGITLEELRARMTPPGGGDGGGRGGGGGFDPSAMFANWDADQDGKLSGDEIPGRMRENLEAIDSDGDGSVTLEEFQERIRRRRAEGGGFGAGGPRGGGRPERPQRPEEG